MQQPRRAPLETGLGGTQCCAQGIEAVRRVGDVGWQIGKHERDLVAGGADLLGAAHRYGYRGDQWACWRWAVIVQPAPYGARAQREHDVVDGEVEGGPDRVDLGQRQ